MEISALLNPPLNMSVIAYALSGFVNIKNEIIEPANRFKDKPINISLETENLEKPLRVITINAQIIAPKKPNNE